MKRLLSAFMLLLVLTLAACTPPLPPVPTPSPLPIETPVPSAGIRWTEQVFGEKKFAPSGALLLDAHYSFPSVEDCADDPVLSEICAHYAGIGHAYEDNIDAVAGQAQDDLNVATSLGEAFTPYTETFDFFVTAETPAYVSFARSYTAATGGDIPVRFQFSELYDLNTGAMLRFADVFPKSEEAHAVVLEAISAQVDPLGITADEVDAALQTDSFYVTQDSFVFYFQPGALTPVEDSVAEFSIPMKTLEGLYVLPQSGKTSTP